MAAGEPETRQAHDLVGLGHALPPPILRGSSGRCPESLVDPGDQGGRPAARRS